MKTGVDRLFSVSKMKKSSIVGKYIGNFFLTSKPKVVYLRPFLFSLPFPEFWKQNVMYFGSKHVETGPNCSQELATFIKYYTTLIYQTFLLIVLGIRRTEVKLSKKLFWMWKFIIYSYKCV